MSNSLLPLLARILIALVFLKSAFVKIQDVEATITHMKDAGITTGTHIFLILAIILLISGSLLLITGYKSKLGAFLLILFLMPATIAFHWNWSDPQQINYLMRNGAYLGALLLIISYGSGNWSLGAKKK